MSGAAPLSQQTVRYPSSHMQNGVEIAYRAGEVEADVI